MTLKQEFLLAHPPAGGIDETKPAASATPSGSAAPATPPAASTAPAATTLPAEFAGKSAEEIYSTLNGRYKDYDSYKGRIERYDKLQATPENIEASRKWIADILGGLNSGKQAAWDETNRRVVWVDPQGNITQPSANNDPPADIFADWDTLDGRTQGQRLQQSALQALAVKEQELVRRYDAEIRNAVARIDQRANLFIDVLERWIENPKINPRELLAKVMEYSGGGNALDLAARELSSPADIQRRVDEGVAAGVADFKARWEKEHAAPPLAPPTGMRPRGVSGSDGKKVSIGELRNRVIGNWRENGLSR